MMTLSGADLLIVLLIVIAVAALFAVVLIASENRLARQQNKLSQQVDTAVEAKLGRTMHEIAALEARVQTALDRLQQDGATKLTGDLQQAREELEQLRQIIVGEVRDQMNAYSAQNASLIGVAEGLQSAEADLAQARAEYAERRGEIDHLTDQLAEIRNQFDELFKRANATLPEAAASGEMTPSGLLLEARRAQNGGESAAILRRLLAHESADSRTLEIAGDLARNALDDMLLAEKLYARSIEVDPENVSARSEYLAVLARDARRRVQAKQEITELAFQLPNRSVIINNAINFFIRTDDYRGLLEFTEKLLEISGEKSLLWRNLAVARTELNFPYEEIREAYAQAFELGDPGDYVNAARPYIRLLLQRGEAKEASGIVDRAVQYSPGEAPLHRLRGEVYRALNDLETAHRSFHFFAELGNQQEKYEAAQLIRNLEILRTLFGSSGYNDKL
jgi:hypothetical protein